MARQDYCRATFHIGNPSRRERHLTEGQAECKALLLIQAAKLKKMLDYYVTGLECRQIKMPPN